MDTPLQKARFESTNGKVFCLIVFSDAVANVYAMVPIKFKATGSHSEDALSLDELWTCGY